MTASVELRSTSPEDTRAIGARLGAALRPGDIVSLTGELGAGKTCLVQGAAAALGVAERVTSPSFILRKDYQGTVAVLHLDVYRLQTLQDVLDIGWEEALDRSRVAFVEWGDAMSPLLPEDYLEVDLRVDLGDTRAEPGAEQRLIGLRPRGADWSRRLAELAAALGDWRA